MVHITVGLTTFDSLKHIIEAMPGSSGQMNEPLLEARYESRIYAGKLLVDTPETNEPTRMADAAALIDSEQRHNAGQAVYVSKSMLPKRSCVKVDLMTGGVSEGAPQSEECSDCSLLSFVSAEMAPPHKKPAAAVLTVDLTLRYHRFQSHVLAGVLGVQRYGLQSSWP